MPLAVDTLSRAAPLTVRAALRLPELAAGRPVVVGGRDGLDRPIRWAHVAEITDVARLLRGGELLLTTGVALPPGAAGRRAWFATLVERGVAAVVLELGPHVRDVPAHLAAAADAHALPLVALREEVAFVAVTEVVHARLLDAQHDLLRRGAELDRRMAEVAAEGGDAGAVVDALVATTGAAVWLCDEGGRVLHGRAVEDAAVVEAPLARAGRRLRLAAPAGAAGDFERLALERGAALLDLLLLRAHHERRLELRRAGAALDRLRDGDAAAAAEVGRRLRAAAPLVPVAVRVPGGAEEALPDVAGALGPALDGPVLVGVHGDEVLLVAAAADRRALGTAVAAAAERVAARRPGGVAVVAVGAHAPSVAAAGPLLAEAAEAAALAPAPAGDRAVVVDVAAPDLERLLAGLRGDPRTARFSTRLLGPVDAHDEAAPAAPLRPTLAALCRAAGNRQAAAAALGVHRQTLYRRIDRLEELTGLDLGSADGLLAAALALRCAPAAA